LKKQKGKIFIFKKVKKKHELIVKMNKKFVKEFKLKKELAKLYLPRFSVVKLTLLSDKIFSYIENKFSKSIEVMGEYLGFKLQH